MKIWGGSRCVGLKSSVSAVVEAVPESTTLDMVGGSQVRALFPGRGEAAQAWCALCDSVPRRGMRRAFAIQRRRLVHRDAKRLPGRSSNCDRCQTLHERIFTAMYSVGS